MSVGRVRLAALVGFLALAAFASLSIGTTWLKPEAVFERLDVITAQLDALQTKQDLQGLQTKQVEASIGLMVALGGGWTRQPG